MRAQTLMLVAVVPFVFVATVCVGTAAAKSRKKVRPARVSLVEAPFGLQGAAGAGANVAIPFRLRDRSYRPSDVDIQFGIDRDADEVISEDEYVHATEARLDWRNTRANRAPQLFGTAADQGAAQAIVWMSDADVGSARIVAGPEFALDPQGRLVRDPFDPRGYAVAYTDPGVRIRLRAVSVSGHKGPWTTSDAFSLSGNHAPSMSIGAIQSGAPVVVGWTAFDADSEDANGNGVLDVADGEDADADGVLDTSRVGVAFDWHRLAAGEDPSAMTDAQLAALSWHACTRVESLGDTDAMILSAGEAPQGGLPAGAPGAGRSYEFAWDAARDAGTLTDGFVLRATPFDAEGDRGATVYSRAVVRPAD